MLNHICYLAILLGTVGVFMFKIRIRKDNDKYVLDRDTTSVLKGYAIIMIMIHHMVLRMSDAGILIPFRIVGYIGVTIFFFLSGYGLVCTAEGREKMYSKGFMLKRVQKIYIPAVFAQLVYMLILLFCFNESYTISGFIKGVLTLYPIDTSQWYIIAIFIWYFCFWFLLKLSISWNARIAILFGCSVVYIAVCLNLGLTKNWIDTAFCFSSGVAFAVHRTKFIDLINKHLIILPVSFLLLGITVLFSFGKETDTAIALRMVSTIALIVTVLMILRFVDISRNKLVAYIGTISLECYLVHGKVIRVVKLYFGDVASMEAVIYLVATVLITAIFVFLVNKYNFLLKKLRRA